MKTKAMENFLSGFTHQMFGTHYTECKKNKRKGKMEKKK